MSGVAMDGYRHIASFPVSEGRSVVMMELKWPPYTLRVAVRHLDGRWDRIKDTYNDHEQYAVMKAYLKEMR